MKSGRGHTTALCSNVAPFAGAWIEIPALRRAWDSRHVAPFAGAWIEMCSAREMEPSIYVAPFMGAWIEILVVVCHYLLHASLPSRERGLKWCGQHDRAGSLRSRPSRERGLKYMKPCPDDVQLCVAPFAGAWIEIFNMATKAVSIDRRSLRGATQIAASPSSCPTSPNLHPSQSFPNPTKTFAHVMTHVL